MRTSLDVMRILLLTTLLSGLVIPGYAEAQQVERLTSQGHSNSSKQPATPRATPA